MFFKFFKATNPFQWFFLRFRMRTGSRLIDRLISSLGSLEGAPRCFHFVFHVLCGNVGAPSSSHRTLLSFRYGLCWRLVSLDPASSLLRHVVSRCAFREGPPAAAPWVNKRQAWRSQFRDRFLEQIWASFLGVPTVAVAIFRAQICDQISGAKW